MNNYPNQQGGQWGGQQPTGNQLGQQPNQWSGQQQQPNQWGGQQQQPGQWGGQQPPQNQWGGQQPGQWSGQQPPYQGQQPNQWNNQYRPQQPAWGAQQLGQYGNQTVNQSYQAFSGSPQEVQLRQLIDELFSKYDRDRSLTLDKKQLAPLFNEVLARFNMGFTLSQAEAEALLYQIDNNRDQKIGKPELFNCLKGLVLNESTRPGGYR